MINENKVVESLKKVKNILEKKDIDFWLDTGTLLGAIREKKFIQWDKDIDIGVFYKDIKKIKECFKELKNSGFEIFYFKIEKFIKILNSYCEIDLNLYDIKEGNAIKTYYIHNKIGRIIDYLRWILTIDKIEYKKSNAPKKFTKKISMARKKSPKIFLRPTNKILEILYRKIGSKKVNIEIPKKFFTTLEDIKFYNLTFKIPNNTEKYLEYRYGKDWRVPNKNYIYYRDDKAIVKKNK